MYGRPVYKLSVIDIFAQIMKKRTVKRFTFQRELQEFLQSQQLRLKPQEGLDDAWTRSKIQQSASPSFYSSV